MNAFRFGFAVRIVGQPGLRSHDSRRHNAAHLSVSLIYLRDILRYLEQIGVRFYRLAANLLPEAATLQQLDDCAPELAVLADQVAAQGVRLSLHLDHSVVLGSSDDALAARSLAAIEMQAALLERLEVGSGTAQPVQSMMVAHVGGAADDAGALERFARRHQALSARARARLAVENDSAGHSLGALLWLHQRCGAPIVFDAFHWQLHNPERLSLDLALGLALATWAPCLRAEVHLSSARSEAHLLPASQGQPARVLPPRSGQHADFVTVADAIQLLRAAKGLPPFDIMLEAKAGDLALLRVREEIGRLAPDLAARLG